jgi:superfamily II DNA or RNA helicase
MQLIEQVRSRAPAAYQARGIKLARLGVVDGVHVEQSYGEEEIVLRVAEPGARASFTVHVWPEEPDWSCDCPIEHDTCPHVVAAIIALVQVRRRRGPDALPVSGERPDGAEAGEAPKRATAKVGYRLSRQRRGFALNRVLVRLGEETLLRDNLDAQKVSQFDVRIVTKQDHAIEAVYRNRWGEVCPREMVTRLFHALQDTEDITLDGKPIKVSPEPVVPHGLVDDDPDPVNPRGFRLRIVRDPSISEVIGNGTVRCDGLLRPIGRGDLTAAQRNALTRGIQYSVDEVRKLVAEALPALRERIPVVIRTRRLPKTLDDKPRLVLENSEKGDILVVCATIVYGDPPTARVERGEMEVFGDVVPIRNRRAEDRLIREAGEQLGLAVGLERNFTGENAVRFVERAASTRTSWDGDAWSHFKRTGPITPKVQIDGTHLDLDLGGADPMRFFDAWMSGARLVRVSDGWAPLPADWLERYGHLVADLLSARDAKGEVPRHALFDLARLAKELDQPPPSELAGLRALVDNFDGIERAPLPADLNAELRVYQLHGVDWLHFLKKAQMGGILADDMGLGKTLQALCVVESPTLVVCPTSVLFNWAAEAAKFRPLLNVNTYHGPNRKLDATADLTITTYGLLRLDIERLKAIQWRVTVLDEAQAIKNPESQVARAAYRLNADFRLTLTGTPVENRLEELWSQLHFTNRGLLGGRRDFRERYEKPIAVGEPGVAAHLRHRIKPFVLRRMKEQVAPELPKRTDMVLRCTLNKVERDTYEAIRLSTRQMVADQLGQGGNVLAALEALLRLRQAACHRGLVPGNQDATGSSKVELLVNTLDEAVSNGHKALVFSQWTSMLDKVEPWLKKAGIAYVRLDGSTRNRGAVVERFQDSEGPPVFLISLKAGGTGLNLTAADHVFLLDPWWNPAVEEQAADRAHRIGQDKPVFVYRLVTEDTVEERILELQDRKRALADAALGDANQAGGITRAELLALLV